MGRAVKADPTSELPAEIELSHSASAIADDDYEDAEAANAIRGY